MSFLAIDVGNTRLKWAYYAAAISGANLLAHGAEFLENIDHLPEGNWAALPRPGRMLGCVVAADAVRRRVEEQLAELWDLPAQWVVPGNGYHCHAWHAEQRGRRSSPAATPSQNGRV